MYLFFKENSWAFFLGCAFAAAGWSFLTWQFYVAIIPVILLVRWSKS